MSGTTSGGDVFILGAGFSRSLNDSMPVLADLWNPLNVWIDAFFPHFKEEGIPLPMGDEKSGDVEALMTYLSSPQPFLSAASNLENEALFLRISEWLAQELFRRQNHATANPVPTQLEQLLERWHKDRLSIISLNYDTLVEAGLSSLRIGGENRILHQHVLAIPIAKLESRYAGTFGEERRETFELIKLHGSLNWYYSGDRSFAGEQIFDVGPIVPWNRSEAPSWASVEEKVAGLVPLVIPPTLSKSPFFNNSTIRELWTRASFRSAVSRRLILIGYSLPLGDLQIRGLLDRTGRGKEVIVVNEDSAVIGRVRDAIPHAVINEDFIGEDCVARFVAHYCS